MSLCKDNPLNHHVDMHSKSDILPSTLSSFIAAQPSFKKLLLSEEVILSKTNNQRLFGSPRSSYLASRWSRNKSSKCSVAIAPTVLQISAGKKIVKKYHQFARNLEYKRLHSIIPSLSKRKYASKVNIFALHSPYKYVHYISHLMYLKSSFI